MNLNEAKAKMKSKAKKAWAWVKDHKWEILTSLVVIGGEAAVGYAGYMVGVEKGVDKGSQEVSNYLYGLEDIRSVGTYYPADKDLDALSVVPFKIRRDEIETGIAASRYYPQNDLSMSDLLSTLGEAVPDADKSKRDNQQVCRVAAWFYTDKDKEAQE